MNHSLDLIVDTTGEKFISIDGKVSTISKDIIICLHDIMEGDKIGDLIKMIINAILEQIEEYDGEYAMSIYGWDLYDSNGKPLDRNEPILKRMTSLNRLRMKRLGWN